MCGSFPTDCKQAEIYRENINMTLIVEYEVKNVKQGTSQSLS